jgi:hypothetical protein
MILRTKQQRLRFHIKVASILVSVLILFIYINFETPSHTRFQQYTLLGVNNATIDNTTTVVDPVPQECTIKNVSRANICNYVKTDKYCSDYPLLEIQYCNMLDVQFLYYIGAVTIFTNFTHS